MDTREDSLPVPRKTPLVWLGGEGLPIGSLRRDLAALGYPLWHEPLGPEAPERLPELDPVLVLVEPQPPGPLLRSTLAALESVRPGWLQRPFPIFLVLEPDEVPPAVRADGCFIRSHDMAAHVRGVLDGLPAWRSLRRERLRRMRAVRHVRLENRRLKTLVVRDDLTELYNLRFFTRSLENEHARATRFGRQYSLVFIDLDGLKEVNTRFGHLTGGRVLKGVGNYLGTRIRHIDVAARIGGDEFVIICPETPRTAARVFSERIRADLEALEIVEQGVSFHVTASFGVASFPDDGDFPEQILERADRALYAAKAKGKNRVCAWADSDATHAEPSRGSLHARVKTEAAGPTTVDS